jgi:PAS domain S-box-containing protein
MISYENSKEDEFRKLSHHLPDLIFQFTRRPDGTYFVPIASRGIEHIFGCTPEDVKESFDAIAKVIHPDDQQRVFEEIEDSAKYLKDFISEAKVCIPGRPTQWILTRSTPEKLPDGTITWYGFSANITKQRDILEKLSSLSKKQEAILKAIPDLIFEVGEDHMIYDFHSYVSDLLIAPPEQFLGKKYHEVLPDNAADVITAAIKETNEKGFSKGLQYHLKVPQGKIWFEVTVTRIENANSANKRYILLARDVTEKKLENDKLKQLMHAVEQSTSSIVITNLEGNLEFVNKEFLNITGYSYDEVIGENPRIINSGYTNKEVYKEMWNTIKSGGTWHGELLNKKKNGNLFWEEVTISPVRNEHKEIINFLAIKTDITKQRKTAEKLRKIAWNQSHQVRGPLTDILGIINLIKMDIPMQEKEELMSHLENAAKKLDVAIHNVIDETSKPL